MEISAFPESKSLKCTGRAPSLPLQASASSPGLDGLIPNLAHAPAQPASTTQALSLCLLNFNLLAVSESKFPSSSLNQGPAQRSAASSET